MKIYSLTIVYDDEKGEIEYIAEEVQDTKQITERGTMDLEGYFDEDDLKLLADCYVVGES